MQATKAWEEERKNEMKSNLMETLEYHFVKSIFISRCTKEGWWGWLTCRLKHVTNSPGPVQGSSSEFCQQCGQVTSQCQALKTGKWSQDAVYKGIEKEVEFKSRRRWLRVQRAWWQKPAWVLEIKDDDRGSPFVYLMFPFKETLLISGI